MNRAVRTLLLVATGALLALPAATAEAQDAPEPVVVAAGGFGLSRWDPWTDELGDRYANLDPQLRIGDEAFAHFDLHLFLGVDLERTELGGDFVAYAVGYDLHVGTDGTSLRHRHLVALRAYTEHVGLTASLGFVVLEPWSSFDQIHAGIASNMAFDVHLGDGLMVYLPTVAFDAFLDVGEPLVSVGVAVGYAPR